MERAVLQNDKGFTLLETIIAMTILTVMMLGTLQALIGTYTFSRNNTFTRQCLTILKIYFSHQPLSHVSVQKVGI